MTSIETVPVRVPGHSYDVVVGAGLSRVVADKIGELFPGMSLHIVTDSAVYAMYGNDFSLFTGGRPFTVTVLPGGEERKDASAVAAIHSDLARHEVDRSGIVIAFGGGVVGDLAGFAAATWLRGIDYIQIPTTLLAQLDSSVGGKTGYNLLAGKNLVGAFHQPRAVFADVSFLRTLDARQVRAGLAEAVKCGLAGDAAFFEKIEGLADRWRNLGDEDLISIISKAVAYKAGVVERDEKEVGERRFLNMGHTYGHAVEQATGYGRYLHGEAVAIGLAWEAAFSEAAGVAGAGLADRVGGLLTTLGFDLLATGLSDEEIAAALPMDKKRTGGSVSMPLTVVPGECRIVVVPVADLAGRLSAVRKRCAGSSDGRPAGRIVSARPDDLLSLEKRVSGTPTDRIGILILAEAYLSVGKIRPALETAKAALELDPKDHQALRIVRRIEAELGRSKPVPGDASHPLEEVIFTDDGALEIRPLEDGDDASEPFADDKHQDDQDPPEQNQIREQVKTVTMADILLSQGRPEDASRLVEEILRDEPANERAAAWIRERAPSVAESEIASETVLEPVDAPSVAADAYLASLQSMLSIIRKEVRHDIS